MKRGPGKGVPSKPLAAPPELRTLLIRELVRDPAYQVRQGLDGATIARYANVLAEGGTMPPIGVAAVNGALVVIDGWHRLAAHERRGIGQIEAEITRATASEARWMAAAANLRHGLPLRKAELRTAFRAMVHARRHIPAPGKLHSYRDLAALLGGLVRHTTISNWMAADFPKIARQMAGEDPIKGTREAVRDDEAGFYNTAQAALATAAANASGVRDPARRGQLIEDAERLLRELREGGRWEAPDF